MSDHYPLVSSYDPIYGSAAMDDDIANKLYNGHGDNLYEDEDGSADEELDHDGVEDEEEEETEDGQEDPNQVKPLKFIPKKGIKNGY